MVVEEHLGADVVCAGVYFGFEVIHLDDAVGCCGVSFGECGDADAEALLVWVDVFVVEFFDEFDEVCCVAEVV